jgi:RIO-like serine/threonine protein kinase
MSILKDLKSKQKAQSKKCIRAGEVILFSTQEEFNFLCDQIDIGDDFIVIDEPYCCSLDHQGVPEVYPLSDVCDLENVLEHFSHRNLKAIDFNKWIKRRK